MRRVDRDQVVWNIAADVFIPGGGRQAGSRHPVGQRHCDVEVFGLDDVGQLLQCAMNVSLAGVPTALCHVYPAAQSNLDLRVRLPKRHLLRCGEIFLPALNCQRVIARWQFGPERVRRNRRMFFKRIFPQPVGFVILDRCALGRSGLHEKPFTFCILNVHTGGEMFPGLLVNNFTDQTCGEK